MKKEMLINMLQPEECRIAILEDGVLEELYVERTSHESYVGNIYKGRIVNIEPSIQAAFVDFGVGRNGFLHVSDVEPAYYRHLEQRRSDQGNGRRGGRRDRPRGNQRRSNSMSAPEALPHSEMVEIWEGEFIPPDNETITPSRDLNTVPISEMRLAPETSEPLSSELAPPPSEDASVAEKTMFDTKEEVLPVVEAPKERRRSRGGSRRRREGSPKRSAPASETPVPPNSPAQEPASDQPRLMESAERRTDDEEEGQDKTTIEAQDLSISDEDIFFPRSQTPVTGLESTAPAREDSLTTTAEQELPFPEPDEERLILDEPQPVSEDDFAEEFHTSDIADERLPEFDLGEEEPRQQRRQQRDNNRRRPGGRRNTGRPGMGRPKPPIQEIFRRGQEVLVQVIKEGIGTKGPTLSTYISIAGRYLVLMPGLNRVGVSRKIIDEEQRRRLREIFSELKPPKGLGFIIRTAGIDRNKKELQRDLAYLSRLWQVVIRRLRKLKSPAEIYQESDMITRTIRDTFTNDIDTIWVDEPSAYEHAREFLQIVMPRYANRIKLYTDLEPLFYKYGIEEEISRIQQRHVPLPHGGSVVIDQTEALVAIDVNSGNFRADNNAEETAYRMNLQAAKEIARQLRLRDLGGVIVNDFIDMRDEKHRRDVERALRDAVKRDRARTKVLRISAFGLIEMTRQRIRPSLKRSVYQDCSHCQSTGQVKTCESMSIDVMRMLQLAVHRPQVQRIHVRVAEDVANYLLNKKRKDISNMEEARNVQIAVQGVWGAPPEMLEFLCYDNNNNEVKFLPYGGEDHLRRR